MKHVPFKNKFREYAENKLVEKKLSKWVSKEARIGILLFFFTVYAIIFGIWVILNMSF